MTTQPTTPNGETALGLTKIQAAKRTTVVSVIVNALLSVLKIFIGVTTHSTALIADGVHSVADMMTDFFTYAIIKVAHVDADDNHPYGHGKFETIGTLFMALFLLMVALTIGYDAFSKLGNPEPLSPLGQWALVAAFISIVANEGLYFYCNKLGRQVKSSIIIANAWHHRTDSLSSIASLIGIAFSLMGFPEADSLAALVITAMLCHIAYKIGRHSFDELVESAVEEDIQKHMYQTIIGTTGAKGVHRLRARRVGGKIFVDAHVDIDGRISVSEGHAISVSVEENLLKAVTDVEDVTVHIDPINIQQIPLPATLERSYVEPLVAKIVAEHCPAYSVHTLYIHLFKKGVTLELTLAGDIPLSKETVNTLKQALTGEETPFDTAQVSVNL